MQTKTILRLACLVAALAVLMWLGIGGMVWFVWRHHQQDLAATASALANPDPLSDEFEPFDRANSSVQYERLTGFSDSANIPPWLKRQIGPLSAGEQTMAVWVAELRVEGVQVCFEQVRRNWQDPDPPFEVSRERASVHEVLDELCRQDARYYWEWMEGSEVVNVLVAGRTEVRLGDVSFRNRPLHKCQAEIEPHLFAVPYAPGQAGDEMQGWPMDMKAQEITVRDYLNLLVDQYDGMTWTVNYFGQVAFDAPDQTREKMRKQLNIRPTTSLDKKR